MRSAIETIARPCSSANARSAAARIIEPSSFTTSQITRRRETGQAREVDGGLGVPGTDEHPA